MAIGTSIDSLGPPRSLKATVEKRSKRDGASLNPFVVGRSTNGRLAMAASG